MNILTWLAGLVIGASLLDQPVFDAQIARKGIPAPIQAGPRWAVERTYSWMNRCGKLGAPPNATPSSLTSTSTSPPRWFTIRQLIQRARSRYRWDTRAPAPSC